MTDGYVIGLSIGLSIFIIVACITCIVRRSRAKQGSGRVFQAPVVVTSASHTAPGGYPTTMQTIPVYPPPANANYQQATYPQQPPYLMSGQSPAMPMPMAQGQMHPNPIGMNPQMMPPYPVAGPSALPPSYDSAVGTNPNVIANPMGYEKQAPYNPNYTTGTGY